MRSPIADEIEGWSPDYHDEFIRKYWQKQPVLIRSAVPNIENMKGLEMSSLFTLSYDEDVESRIIKKKGNRWTKEYGPFEPDIFSDEIQTSNWTLLVQEVDRHIPEVADLWNHFGCVPSWRRDDIMVSYAAPGGGIGAHVDNYDVFLLQGR